MWAAVITNLNVTQQALTVDSLKESRQNQLDPLTFHPAIFSHLKTLRLLKIFLYYLYIV